MHILLCISSYSHTGRAMEVGAHLAKEVASVVDILFVTGKGDAQASARVVKTTVAELEHAGIHVTVHQRVGQLSAEIVRQAQSTPYDLVVIGSRGRKGIVARLLGSVAREVSGCAPASVLVIKGRVRELQRLLVCTAAGPDSENAVRFAGQLAQALGASITLLHVMSQLPLSRGAVLKHLEASADELIRFGAREGIHLSHMMALLAMAGVEVRTVVRHGLVMDEIRTEAQEGRYDLIVIGAHITPGVKPIVVEDLASDILLAAARPVLTVRIPRQTCEVE